MCEDTHSSHEVREAALTDVSAIQNLHHALCQFEHENGFDPDIDLEGSYSTRFTDYLRSRILEPTGVALVAMSQRLVVGYLVGSVNDAAKGKRAKLESMFVLPEYRKRGVGRGLVSEFLSWVQGVGAVAATVAVAPGNAAAVGLYRELGFRGQTLVLEARPPVWTEKTKGTPTTPCT